MLLAARNSFLGWRRTYRLDGFREESRTTEGNKPGSVTGRSPWGHLSGTPVTRRLMRPTRSSNAADHRSLLLGLAPGGVCRATAVSGARGGLLPHRFTLTCAAQVPPSAVCSLLHFPSPCGARALPGTKSCGARTFLEPSLAADPRPRFPPPILPAQTGRFLKEYTPWRGIAQFSPGSTAESS